MEEINLCKKFQRRFKANRTTISNNKLAVQENTDLKADQEEQTIENTQKNGVTIFESQAEISKATDNDQKLPSVTQTRHVLKHLTSNAIDYALSNNKNITSRKDEALDDGYSFDSISTKNQYKSEDGRQVRCMINYSKDTSRKPLFKIGMKIPEFYSPPINNDKIKVVNFAPKNYGKEIRRDLLSRQRRRRPVSIFDKSNYCLEKLLNGEHIDL